MKVQRLMYDLRAIWQRGKLGRELEDELEYHLEQLTAENVRRGMHPEEARRSARASLGGVEWTKEEARGIGCAALVDAFRKDIHYSIRGLVRRPLFAVTIALTLGLGIGANVAVFSVVNAVLLRPLPFAHPEELVAVWEREVHSIRVGGDRSEIAPANLMDWNSKNRTFIGITAFAIGRVALTSAGDPADVPIATVATDLLQLVGVRPLMGRAFRPEEGAAGGSRVVLMSDRLWRSRFGADPRLVGKPITIDGTSATVIGIVPAAQAFPRDVDLWQPLAMGTTEGATRSAHFLHAIGRIRPGVTVEQARADLTSIAGGLQRQYPVSNANVGISVFSLRDEEVGSVRLALLVLFAAVGFVLLIACANVGGLLLARAAARRPEMALRTALGAGRGRLVQQLLTESVLLSLVGAAIGLLVGVWGTRFIVSLSPVIVTTSSGPVSLDARIVLITLGVSVLTGVVFGLAPAFHAAGRNLRDALQAGGRQAQGASTKASTRGFLVAGELALTMVLLGGAGLMLRSLAHLEHVDLGFTASNLLTAEIRLPAIRYPGTTVRTANFYNQLTRDLRAVPGVQSAGAVFMLPLGGDNRIYSFRRFEDPAKVEQANFRIATAGYLATIGAAILRGRDFTDVDSAGGAPTVIINETMAQRFWPGVDPVGRRINVRGDPVPRMIIGVARDIRHFGPGAAAEAEMYVPHPQVPASNMTVVVRTSGDPLRMAGALQARVHALDKDLPVTNLRTMGDLVERSLSLRRFALRLLAGFAIAALMLSSIGVYGLVAYSVAQRRSEIGIRMALGARWLNVVTLITGEIIKLAAAGVLVGTIGAVALGRLLSSMLYEVGAADLPTLIVAASTLAGVALLACAIPALQAARISPVTAMRHV